MKNKIYLAIIVVLIVVGIYISKNPEVVVSWLGDIAGNFIKSLF